MITLVTVTKPENHAELENCISTVTRHAYRPHEWLFITERENVAEVEEIVNQYSTHEFQVISMACLKDEIEDVPHGYNRQRLGKLYAHREAANEKLLFLDDDVEAIEEWKEADFFTADGLPIVYFNRTKNHTWKYGTAEAFATDRTDKQFQIALPFAYTVTLAKKLEASRPMARAWRSYREGPSAISDFELMGNFAFTETGAKIVNQQQEKSHWTISRNIFSDWQGRRKELRARLGTKVE